MSSSKPFYHHFLALSLTTFITMIMSLLCDSQYDPSYTNCSQPFKCGDTSVVGQLKYPFWGINRPSYCGVVVDDFQIKCINNKPIIWVNSFDLPIELHNFSMHQNHLHLSMHQNHLQLIATDPQNQIITVVSAAFSNTLCPPSLFNNKNFTNLSIVEKYLDNNFNRYNNVTYLTILYGCPSDIRSQLSWSGQDSCTVDNTKVDVHFVTHTVNQSQASRCLSYVTLPIHQESARALEDGSITLREALNKGFELDYSWSARNCDSCLSSGGQCGDGTCYCPDKPYPVQCPYYKRIKPGSVNSSISSRCSNVVLLPILQDSVQTLNDDPSTLPSVLSQGFEMKWTTMQDKKCQSCMRSGGECGFDWSKDKFTCYCPHNSQSCLGGKHKTIRLIVVSVGAVVALLSILGGCLLINQKSNQNLQNHSVEDSLRNYASLVPKRYAYKYIKKVTKCFREKLGEGGYGTVFKGSLKDGRVVAVKVWKQLKGDGQDFLNEVMSISRTSHINVVPLVGFCFEGHKRALIYEFMPNGSLEKFLQGRYFSENDSLLSAQKLFEIGVGVARGLEYLHRGCNTRIVHFDIKPHNILLDAEFIPKISDFGLAKSCQQKESLISMSEARGTIGYIAPEVFFRTYGGVSHKSDVYSFGMMILEMAGCKNKVHENADNSSEMYFPQWIYKQLEQGTISINCDRILNEEEAELERKMILVGLWCIQTNPVNRPSMNRVVEMLEGKVLLDVPSMPTLCTPPRQQLTNNDSVSFLSSTIDAPTL